MAKCGLDLCFMRSNVKQERGTVAEMHKCNTCRAVFEDVSEQKSHYKSEWHLYNLKRKGAGIEAVSYDDFLEVKERLLQMMDIRKNGKQEKKERGCGRVRKSDRRYVGEIYGSGGAAEERNHTGKSVVVGGVTSADYDGHVCLFSGKRFDSVEDNVKWMERTYSFFIPEKEYVVDKGLLLSYLHDKIHNKFTCIHCDRVFKSCYAVLHHMEQKQHRKLEEEAIGELGEFYDFMGSYAELLGRFKRRDNSEGGDEENDDEWEDIVTTKTDCSVVIKELACYGLEKASTNRFGNLRLPDGREAVHRDVFYVYNQHLVSRRDYRSGGEPVGFKFLKREVKKGIVRGEIAMRREVESRRYKREYKSYKLFVPCNQIAFAT
ncbi:hypothetical protein BgAZ_208220 [Babesia gibsoni]|uniref:C2H2-type domain-containing protein n=1 Tax=Babesia gibsoni TaxID=33632 RepID=A0AAD8PEM5_BABGI|nr:hypothetical protein BgAZ_208220 [Babesia gibsoni]